MVLVFADGVAIVLFYAYGAALLLFPTSGVASALFPSIDVPRFCFLQVMVLGYISWECFCFVFCCCLSATSDIRASFCFAS